VVGHHFERGWLSVLALSLQTLHHVHFLLGQSALLSRNKFLLTIIDSTVTQSVQLRPLLIILLKVVIEVFTIAITRYFLLVIIVFDEVILYCRINLNINVVLVSLVPVATINVTEELLLILLMCLIMFIEATLLTATG